MKKLHDKFFTAWWHEALAAAISFALAYLFGSLAVDTGSYWDYLATFVFLGLGVRCAVHSFKRHHGKK